MMRYLALVLLFISPPVEAATLSGRATVVDGDTIEVSGRKVRLVGIDAPEADQSCDRSGEAWACGSASAERLRDLIGANSVTCSGTEVDQYARLLAVCSAGSVDLNRAMVAEGWATAFRRYSQAYVADENDARANKRGLWASSFVPPEDHRRAEDQAATTGRERSVRAASSQPSSACLIKGNRNNRGEWIYHLPGKPYYDQTQAEEMFCTEAEARAAGYRRSRAR